MATRIAPHFAALLLFAVPISGCTTALAPVDVTRFHGEAVPRTGTIVVLPADARDAGSLEFRTIANAVAASLGRAGFSPRDEGGAAAEFKAVVTLSRVTQEPAPGRRSPVSVGVGGATGSYGSGLGLGIGINLSGKPKPLVATQLSVQIRTAADDKAIWEGRAETAAKQGTPAAQPGMAAGKLADALFRDFPGPSGKTITVK